MEKCNSWMGGVNWIWLKSDCQRMCIHVTSAEWACGRAREESILGPSFPLVDASLSLNNKQSGHAVGAFRNLLLSMESHKTRYSKMVTTSSHHAISVSSFNAYQQQVVRAEHQKVERQSSDSSHQTSHQAETFHQRALRSRAEEQEAMSKAKKVLSRSISLNLNSLKLRRGQHGLSPLKIQSGADFRQVNAKHPF